MRALASGFFALSATAALLLGCDASRPLDPSFAAYGSLAVSGSQPAAPVISGASATLDGEIDLGWQDNSSNETGFEVHRSTTGESGTFTLLATTAANAVAYADKGLATGAQYCYRVRAVRVSGGKASYSAFSNSICAIAALGTPSSVTAVAASAGQIDLTWKDNSGSETGFQIYRTNGISPDTYSLLVTTGANAVSYSDKSLVDNRQYCYRIVAVRSDGSSTISSATSSSACATTPVAPLPPAPSTAASDVKATPNGSTVTVSWSYSSTTAVAFRVDRSTDDAATWEVADTYATVKVFYDQLRPSEQRVCYRVVAFNGGGDAPPSNTACTTPPAAPAQLSATLVDDQTFELTWSDDSAVE